MGIGAALSHEAAARGLNVLMLARGAQQLEDTAAAVRDGHDVEVRTLASDLTDPGVIDKVCSRNCGHRRRPIRVQRRGRSSGPLS